MLAGGPAAIWETGPSAGCVRAFSTLTREMKWSGGGGPRDSAVEGARELKLSPQPFE